MCNRKGGKLGTFLFSVEIANPQKESTYFINWRNKLDFGNCDTNVMKEEIDGCLKESIVVSYKSIGINTFNVFVFDLETKLIRFWNESY
jgi:hypothetical protein